MINKNIGQHFAAIATTSIIKNDGYKNAARIRNAFDNSPIEAQADIKSFSINFDNDLFLGYWNNQEYEYLEANMQIHSDIKSQKFINLGSVAWSQIFATSPAEPGLTNFRPLYSETQGNILSSGGWSDLHPTIVLSELEDKQGRKICDKVYYITRRDGASTFGQRVFLKLIGKKDTLFIQPKSQCVFAKDSLNETYDSIKNGRELSLFTWVSLVNNDIDKCMDVPDDVSDSAWGRLSYWYNPRHYSSFKKSTDIANDVFCTDWNRFDVLAGELDILLKNTFEESVWRNEAQKKTDHVLGCW